MQENKTNNVLTGFVSVTFRENDNLNSLCSRLAGYNADRFEAVALRFFTGDETVVTIYAHDKSIGVTNEDPKVKVHKFKVPVSLTELFSQIGQMNFTISGNQYDMWEMEVTNK